MTLRARFYIALASSFVAIGIHLLANDLYLYWTYRQIDIFVHMVGGVMAGLYTLVFLRYFKLAETLGHVLLGTLLVGIGWEVLELFYKVDEWDLYYWLDSFKDIIDDLIGGWVALIFWRRLPEPKVANTK